MDPKYKPFKYATKDSMYNKAMMKPDKYCTDQEIRIKAMMAAEAGDDDNWRQVPVRQGFGQIGKGQYTKNPHYNKSYNDFMMKPDSKCSEKELRLKFEMAGDIGDIDNQRQVPINGVWLGYHR